MYKGNDDEVKKLLPELYEHKSCGSSDALRVYEHTLKDGRVYYDATCFSCHKYENNPPGFEANSALKFFKRTASPVPPLSMRGGHAPTQQQDPQDVLSEYNLYPYRELKDRHITQETCERYGVRVTLSETNGEPVTHLYPRYKGGKMTGYKQRIIDPKQFYSKGDCREVSLFGTHVVKPNGKTLYITEGELDALSLYQVLKAFSTIPGWEPSVVSLSNGASSAAKDISIDYDFVNSFEKVVLCFDMDDAGKAATLDACKILAGKAYIATYA